MAVQLPTLDECTSILTKVTNDNPASLTEWTQTVHRCLSHACECLDNNEPSSEQAEAAAKLIGDALQWHLENKSSSSSSDEELNHSNDAVICAVVESIWLMDSLIDSSKRQSLISIVSHLTQRTATPSTPQDNNQPRPLLPLELLQTSLEFSFLKEANLLPASSQKASSSSDPVLTAAKQKYMKVNANLYYRQHKFNLFVEESEGYAKLLSYLIGLHTDEEATRHVRALIGAFDLDPNRVLDVALDALEWELKEKCLVDRQGELKEFRLESVRAAVLAIYNNKEGGRIHALLGIIRDLDGASKRAVAHLLGFKYRYYARGKDKSSKSGGGGGSNAATGASQYPISLYLSTAFLAMSNVLDVHDLLPHLIPEKKTHNLLEVYSKYCMETVGQLKKMGVISLNSKSSGREEAKTTEEDVDPFVNDPVVGIFRMILTVGKWDDAVVFLANAATAEEFKGAISAGDCDKLEKMMKSIMLAVCSLSDAVALDVCGWVSCVVEDVYKSKESTGDALVDKDSGLEDVSSVLLEPLSCLIGSGKIRLNQPLYLKLCAMYRSKLAAMKLVQDGKEVEQPPIDADTLAVLSTFLVPSLSLFPSNPDLSRELWSVLQLLPHTIRYKLYSTWRSPALEKGALRSLLPKDIKSGNFSKPLECIKSEIQTGIEARNIMKRISKENIVDYVVLKHGKEHKMLGKGRELSDVSHNNPLVVFSYILNQMESYDNLIYLMVDAFQYVTALGLDVIGYCLLFSLGGAGDDGQRNRTKGGGLNTEQWLASLETFTGAFYKRFPDVELRGLLSFIVLRLQEGEASELGVLRTLIKTAGGYGFVDYDTTSSLSELQLDGRCGSRLLKLETSSFGVVDNVNPRASRMLRTVLQEKDMGVIILILLSQIRQKVLYSKSESKEHIKVMGRLYDNCESVLCLLLEYISDSSGDLPQGPSTKEKFANSLPPLGTLCDTYRLDTATAWMLVRPLFRKSLFYMDDKKLAGKTSSGPPAFLKPFSPTPDMTSSYKSLLPESAWKYISLELFEAFYSLTIYDIQCPSERYDIEINRLNKEVERLTQLEQGKGISSLVAAAAAAGGTEAQIRDAAKFTDTHRKELERLKLNVDKLKHDFSRQQKRCEIVIQKLEAQKDSMVKSSGSDARSIEDGLASAFLTFCIYPRFLSSPEDALFCAYFTKLMHKMRVPGFSIIELIDNIVNAATGSFYCVTEDEAGNLAIFLNEIWKWTNSWRYDNDSFASELKGTPGSRLSKTFSQAKSIGDHALTDGITHDDYKSIFAQWHLKIGSAAVGCLNSSEYMHTRSALIVLSRIVLMYPTQPKVGVKLLEILDKLAADESRPDICATAKGYASQLAKARDEGMWKEENIAVTRARQEKEQMKAEERRKKLAQQHEDIKKESEMITREIGEGRVDSRPDGSYRQGGRYDSRGRPWPNNHQGPPLSVAASVFIPRGGAPPRELNSTSQQRDGHDRRDDVWERDRGGGGGGSGPGRHHDRGYSRPSSHAGSDGHDSRRHGDDSGARRKRSRSPEPGEDTERDKRFKPAQRSSSSPPRGSRNTGSQQSSSRGDRSDRRPERKTRSGRH